MSVRKKNLSVRNIEVYPLDFDMSKRGFVRFYTEGGKKVRIIIPKRFDTVELRQKEAHRLVSSLEEYGYQLQPEAEIPPNNEHC